jgi:excinuclease ABC subunit C
MPLDTDTLVKNLPASPGVYRMLGEGGEVLYVGKARDLRQRVRSYFRRTGQPPKVRALVRLIEHIEVNVTLTETEALLLENNLVKTLHPRFNILLRDDKSYPYIFISETQPFPRLTFHRGARREPGKYFGPYPSAAAVRETLNLLQKLFQLRPCADSFFRNRSRPCLQYQIRRCSAPCVGFIDHERYLQDVRHAHLFLSGRSRAVIEDIVGKMEAASARQDYEAAAQYRNRIAALKRIQEKQYVVGESGDADVLAVTVERGTAGVEVAFVRGGLHLGSKSYFLKIGAETKPPEILAAFLPQYYLGRPVPERLYLNCAIPDKALLEETFSRQAGRKLTIGQAPRGAPRRWVRMAEINAKEALRRMLAGRDSLRGRYEALRDALGFEAVPGRVECFDVSHTQGEAAVAACVVFDAGGPVKSEYRRFNIEGVQPGDDYGSLAQALERRYRRVQEGEGRLPDLLLIDGGKGQVAAAARILEELQIADIRLLGVAKGRRRRPGREQLFLSGTGRATILPTDSPALHLIQQIRDEAHRFAVTGHRLRRARKRTASVLEQIPGVGDKRRQALLKNLGGLREVKRADVEDLACVPGINRELARRIYNVFHDRGA